MEFLHALLVNVHIAAGAIVLVLFWIPAFARKGSQLHVKVGKVYVALMHIVVATAFVASVIVLADPIGIRRPGESYGPAEAAELAARFQLMSLFLLMLSVLVFTSLRHGILALRQRIVPGLLARPSHRLLLGTLGVLGLIVGILGIARGAVLLIIFGGISLTAAFGMFRDTLVERPDRKARLVAHLNGLIGSGIGVYTAFFAFGGSRLLGEILTGYWQVVPWILPAIIGTIVINRLERSYKRPAS